ncbi:MULTISPECIES: hypothetical protein [Dinoroseobacter]|jgi:rRNA maturation endonuclease Nob1|nr:MULTISPECIES: hypothetical protein [Dinoroseobacter]MDD9718769.1 hypothetical protein [Dinoroseobacter sp. PD6]URF48899.1 hypothetical protein M8008_19630 [Dinoroseobacter shibae]URF53211.1 hypothetical protein M8007_19655 [Dinoroseobacter shibae]
MKRILTYTTALTLLAAPALADMSADAKMDLVRNAQQLLNEYDIAADADSLSTAQLAEIQALDVSDRSVAEQRLEQIVGASATDTNVTADVSVPDVEVATPDSEVVQSILDDFDIAADADNLTEAQKAEILAVDMSDRSQAEMKLKTIVSG